MSPLFEHATTASLISIQLLGLASLICARLAHRCPYCLAIFSIAMATVVGTTAMSALLGNGWFVSGITLSLMAVGATIDFRRPSAARQTFF